METLTENLPTRINGSNKIAMLSNETISTLVLNGDLSRLNAPQKVEYYHAFCSRIGLDPATQPFKLLKLNGKEILYCDRGGAAQLNKQHLVSHKIIERKKEEDIYSVIANASTPDGRQSESIGAVSIGGLKGDALANAMMKAETKAKRRSTLDLLGLGMLDESEISSIPSAENISLEPQENPYKKLRGKLNAALLKCTNEDDLKNTSRDILESYGKEIWETLTGFKPNETFKSVYGEHLNRVNGIDPAKAWGIKMENCSNYKEYDVLMIEYKAYPFLETTVNNDLISEKIKQLAGE